LKQVDKGKSGSDRHLSDRDQQRRHNAEEADANGLLICPYEESDSTKLLPICCAHLRKEVHCEEIEKEEPAASQSVASVPQMSSAELVADEVPDEMLVVLKKRNDDDEDVMMCGKKKRIKNPKAAASAPTAASIPLTAASNSERPAEAAASASTEASIPLTAASNSELPSEAEIDNRIASIELKLCTEPLSVEEERKYLEEIKELKRSRRKVCSWLTAVRERGAVEEETEPEQEKKELKVPKSWTRSPVAATPVPAAAQPVVVRPPPMQPMQSWSPGMGSYAVQPPMQYWSTSMGSYPAQPPMQRYGSYVAPYTGCYVVMMPAPNPHVASFAPSFHSQQVSYPSQQSVSPETGPEPVEEETSEPCVQHVDQDSQPPSEQMVPLPEKFSDVIPALNLETASQQEQCAFFEISTPREEPCEATHAEQEEEEEEQEEEIPIRGRWRQRPAPFSTPPPAPHSSSLLPPSLVQETLTEMAVPPPPPMPRNMRSLWCPNSKTFTFTWDSEIYGEDFRAAMADMQPSRLSHPPHPSHPPCSSHPFRPLSPDIAPPSGLEEFASSGGRSSGNSVISDFLGGSDGETASTQSERTESPVKMKKLTRFQ